MKTVEMGMRNLTCEVSRLPKASRLDRMVRLLLRRGGFLHRARGLMNFQTWRLGARRIELDARSIAQATKATSLNEARGLPRLGCGTQRSDKWEVAGLQPHACKAREGDVPSEVRLEASGFEKVPSEGENTGRRAPV